MGRGVGRQDKCSGQESSRYRTCDSELKMKRCGKAWGAWKSGQNEPSKIFLRLLNMNADHRGLFDKT